MIHGAVAGAARERTEFALRYEPIIRAYLAARWQASPSFQELDDAAQEGFVECFKEHGVLQRAERDRSGGFRSFLFGVVRNVALRLERSRRQRERRAADDLPLETVEDDDPSASRVFDRAWSRALLREAGRLHAEQARSRGPEAVRRVELLRLRFDEGSPIREIGQRWGCDAAVLHHEYAKARQEFKAALLEVVAFHQPGSPAEVEQECASLLASLG